MRFPFQGVDLIFLLEFLQPILHLRQAFTVLGDLGIQKGEHKMDFAPFAGQVEILILLRNSIGQEHGLERTVVPDLDFDYIGIPGGLDVRVFLQAVYYIQHLLPGQMVGVHLLQGVLQKQTPEPAQQAVPPAHVAGAEEVQGITGPRLHQMLHHILI